MCGKNEIATLVIAGLMLAPIIRGSLASQPEPSGGRSPRGRNMIGSASGGEHRGRSL